MAEIVTDWDETTCPRCGTELRRHDDGAPGEAIMYCPNPDCEVRRIVMWDGGGEAMKCPECDGKMHDHGTGCDVGCPWRGWRICEECGHEEKVKP